MGASESPVDQLDHRFLNENSEKDKLFKEASGYLKGDEMRLLESAYKFSDSAHFGQYRKTGDPYVSHPTSVAHILTKWRLDSQTLVAAMLHDVVEDTETTKSEIKTQFGDVVAELVDGVSKLDQIKFESRAHQQAENFRKMLLAMSRDVRVILIKLADRLHNMRTLGGIYRRKRLRIAQETAEIYGPIANRLGLNNVFEELQELSFRHLYPNRYKVITKALKKARGNRRELIADILNQTKNRLREQKIECQVSGREKNTFSVYRKMREKALSFAEVYDIYGFRVIVNDVMGCYRALGTLHQMFKPVPGKFKDYIAIPKSNGYQSLHTTLLGPYGTPIEIQIRTVVMHRIAEAGVASHWQYKERGSSLTDLQTKTHQWLKNLLEIHMEYGSSTEFLDHLKVDLFPDEVYVLTPKGDILSLPYRSTCVDFAYAVHTDIGNHTIAAKINHELVPLRTRLKTGERIEIITGQHSKPSRSWLDFVVTAKARYGIRNRIKNMRHQDAVQLGQQILGNAFKALGGDVKTLTKIAWKEISPKFEDKNRNQILSDIGLGKVLALVVARSLMMATKEVGTPNKADKEEKIIIKGSEGMSLEFCNDCNPIPGDEIVGQMQKGRGLFVHLHNCKKVEVTESMQNKMIGIAWSDQLKEMFTVKISLLVTDSKGILAEVASEITKTNSNITSAVAEPGDSSVYSSMVFTIQVSNRIHLATIVRGLRKIPEVIRINRIKN